ncbi:MAG: DUF1918 domain-containing protein [Actinomycetota bacterium]
MPKVGDWVIVEGSKVGQQRREGSLLRITGTLMTVRWNDGSESMISPAAGTCRFESRAGGSKETKAAKAPAKKADSKKKAAKKR